MMLPRRRMATARVRGSSLRREGATATAELQIIQEEKKGVGEE